MGKIVYDTIQLPWGGERQIRIYFPTDYDQSTQTYPVLYMHDGQNLFDATTAYGGCSWGVKETLSQREETLGSQHGIICVGIDNGGLNRFNEYSPWSNSMPIIGNAAHTLGGHGDEYAEFFVKNLVPYINQKYRTIGNFEHQYLAGSSMGGLVTAYIGARYPSVFSRLGIFSIASFFAEEQFIDFIKANTNPKSGQRYFVQVGTNEIMDPKETHIPQLYIDGSLKYVHQLLVQGVPPKNVYLGVGVGDGHNEAAWANKFPKFIEFCTKD